MNETLKWKGLRPVRPINKTWSIPYEWNPEMKGIETTPLRNLRIFLCMNETLKWKGLRLSQSITVNIGTEYEWNPEMKGIETSISGQQA